LTKKHLLFVLRIVVKINIETAQHIQRLNVKVAIRGTIDLKDQHSSWFWSIY